MVRSRIILIPLLERYRASSVGNLFGAGTTKLIEIDAPEFTSILPHAEELVLYTNGELMSANFNWGIFFTSGYERQYELALAPFQIGGTVTQVNPGPTRHAAYTTIGNFQLASRLFLGVGNSGGALLETGICNAVLAVKTVGT